MHSSVCIVTLHKMAETFVVRDEFTVEHSSINIIQNNEAKLVRFFNVKVIYLSRKGGKVKNNFEWLRLEGDEDNRQNAKEYIIALTKPSESKVLPFPVEMYDFGDQEFLECIEKQTRAHIEQTGSGSVKIHGNSLSVTLALSILEDKINNFINRKKTLGNITKHRDVPNFPSENGFRCLNDSPQKRLSDFNDYNSKTTDSPSCVKHSILENFSHNNSNSSQDSMNNLLSIQRSQFKNDKILQNPSSTNLRYSEISAFENALRDTDKEHSARMVVHQPSSEISSEACALSSERLTFFTNLAKQIGHVPSDIQEALKMASDDMKPSHFIRLLNNIKEEREIVEKEERENDNQTVSDCSESTDSKLPIKYIELLLNDYKEEAGISSIEELKRRNQARQQCLQQHTQSSKKSSPKDFLPQTGWDSTKKKKTKKKPVRMPDPVQIVASNYAETLSQINSEKTPNLGLCHENGKSINDKITSSHSYKSAVMCSSDVEECSTVSFRSNLGKAANSSFIYSDKRHTESDLRTCMLNKTDEHHTYYSSANSGSVEKMESNHFLVQMDLEKNDTPDNDDLRYIVIDGSNIAMAHGNGKFSCKGIQISVNYFVQRGHNVMVFVPQHKLCAPGPSNIILDQEILYQLKEKGHLAFTPSRKLQGKLINCYDDRFILSLAEREDGIIVSNDQYRDLMQEKASWKEIVEKRLLMYTFVKDNFMLPEDPLGRDGPMLDEFLRKSPKDGNCTPKKSSRPTYRPQFVPQRQLPQPQLNYQILRGRSRTRQGNNVHLDSSIRSTEETQSLYRELKTLFSERDQEEIVNNVLCDYPSERDLNRLSNICVQMIFGN